MDLNEVMFYLAMVSSVVLVVQSILSWFADMDMSVEFDSSFGMSDFLSFKGVLHFLLGFSWMGYLNGMETIEKSLMAVAVGIIFVVLLAYLYKKVYSLAETKRFQSPIELIGREAQLLNFYQGTGRISIDFDGRRTDMNVRGPETLKSGDFVRIKDYQDGFLIVEPK